MKRIAEAFQKSIADFPKQLLSDAIDKKLRAQGVKLSKYKLERFTESALNGEPIDIDGYFDRIKRLVGIPVKEIVLEFTDEDSDRLTKIVRDFEREIPKIVKELLETTPPKFLKSLKSDWPRESKLQAKDRAGFKKRLHGRWGGGLELLRMFITISREIGSELNQERDPNKPSALAYVLTRLHARGCQIAEEVACLLENGFADGAMARWRTLYEIAAVSSLLSKSGELIAERYIEHEDIEGWRAAHLFQKHHQRLNQPPMTQQEITAVDARKTYLISKYGPDFVGHYGWAAGYVTNPSVTTIIEASNIGHLAPYYKLASHNVHANPKGIFFKLGEVGEPEVLIAGASNAGLADPGHSTAISLLQITVNLALLNPTIDDLIHLKILQTLEDEIGEALIAAHHKLQKDEEAFRKGGGTRS